MQTLERHRWHGSHCYSSLAKAQTYRRQESVLRAATLHFTPQTFLKGEGHGNWIKEKMEQVCELVRKELETLVGEFTDIPFKGISEVHKKKR